MKSTVEDLTGKKFGSWLVLERDNKKYKTNDIRWICQCECGTVKSVLGKYLRTGKSLSCGCGLKKDLTGRKFDKLTVLKTLYNYKGYNRATYESQCECGKIIYVKGAAIYRTTSCGCNRRGEDLTGKRFGKLIVTKMIYENVKETKCECQCDCGSIIIVKRNALIDKNTQSCGCVHNPSLLNQRFGKLRVIKEIPNDTSQRTWECKCDCGATTYLTTHLLLSGHTKSCGCLRSETTSYNEIYIAQILADNQINFEREKVFKNCKHIKSLRYDFYLPDYNLCIEYDGEQHYKPIEYFGGETAFKERQNNDRIKNKYCEDNNIGLIRIPYTYSPQKIYRTIIDIIQ